VAPADADALLRRVDGLARAHQRQGDLLVIYADDAEAVHEAARTSGLPVHLQAARPATLEDVFLRLTGRSLREGEAPAEGGGLPASTELV
jgi:hypothetical protein